MMDDDDKKTAGPIVWGILSPHFDWQPQLNNARFDKLVWDLEEAGHCCVPETYWIN